MSNDTWLFFMMNCRAAIHLLLRLRKDGVNVGDHTAGGDGRLSEEVVELDVVLDGELDVARDDAVLLVVLGSVARELEKLRDEVLEDRGHVDRSAGTNALGVAATLQEAAKAADRKGQTSLRGLRLAAAGLLAAGALVSLAGHGKRRRGSYDIASAYRIALSSVATLQHST